MLKKGTLGRVSGNARLGESDLGEVGVQGLNMLYNACLEVHDTWAVRNEGNEQRISMIVRRPDDR